VLGTGFHLAAVPAAACTSTATAGSSGVKLKSIGYRLLEKAFVWFADFAAAQAIANRIRSEKLQKKFDQLAALCCPVHAQLGARFTGASIRPSTPPTSSFTGEKICRLSMSR
jgi:hypothetical protein